jgi:hypothetical protein
VPPRGWGTHTMSDRHIRILRLIAHHRQRELYEYDVHVQVAAGTSMPARRRNLQRAANTTRAKVASAEERRRS